MASVALIGFQKTEKNCDYTNYLAEEQQGTLVRILVTVAWVSPIWTTAWHQAERTWFGHL